MSSSVVSRGYPVALSAAPGAAWTAAAHGTVHASWNVESHFDTHETGDRLKRSVASLPILISSVSTISCASLLLVLSAVSLSADGLASEVQLRLYVDKVSNLPLRQLFESKLARERSIVIVKAPEEADATISIRYYRKGPTLFPDNHSVETHAEVGGEALGPFAASGERGAAVGLATTRLVEALWVLFDPSILSDGASVGSLPEVEHRKPSEVKGQLVDAAVHEGRKGNWKQSAELWKRYLKLVPDDDLAYYNLGLTLMRWEHWQDAKGAFRHSLELNDSNDLAHYQLGFCFYHLGENRQARRSLEAALKMNPELEVAKELLRRIANEK